MASGGIHFVTGFALGSRCRSIPAAFLAGVASHAALDALPHHDYRQLAAHAADAAAGFTLTGALWRRCCRDRRMAGLAGAVGAVLPDVENVLLLLGRMDEERMRFPSHTGLTPHGQAGHRDTCVFNSLVLAAAWVLVSPDRQTCARTLPARSVPRAEHGRNDPAEHLASGILPACLRGLRKRRSRAEPST